MQINSKLPPDAAEIFTIWPGTPPGSEEATWHEQSTQDPDSATPREKVRNVSIPTLTLFKPAEGTANGTTLIVAPGGGFRFLMMDYEGYDVARWLTGLGVTVFVLKYRLQHLPENDADVPAFVEKMDALRVRPTATDTTLPVAPPLREEARSWGIADGLQAIRFLRQNAAELGIDPNRIGIVGFSAGGCVAVNAALEYDSESRPDFAAGIYPAYRSVDPIPADVPPLFVAIADDDEKVAPISSARLYEAWHKVGQSVELHVFANGGHGFGMKNQNTLSSAWTGLFESWLAAQGYI